MLGIIMFWMFRGYSISTLNQVIYTLFSVLLIAVLDEYDQFFVARTSSVRNVMLDFSSGIIGVFILYLVGYGFKRKGELK